MISELIFYIIISSLNIRKVIEKQFLANTYMVYLRKDILA
jgi:hypothetical protein